MEFDATAGARARHPYVEVGVVVFDDPELRRATIEPQHAGDIAALRPGDRLECEADKSRVVAGGGVNLEAVAVEKGVGQEDLNVRRHEDRTTRPVMHEPTARQALG